jgi:hypothetical protein
MSMNFRFSGGYGDYEPVESTLVCCYSNTNSAGVLQQQRRATDGNMGFMPDDTGGPECFLR